MELMFVLIRISFPPDFVAPASLPEDHLSGLLRNFDTRNINPSQARATHIRRACPRSENAYCPAMPAFRAAARFPRTRFYPFSFPVIFNRHKSHAT